MKDYISSKNPSRQSVSIYKEVSLPKLIVLAQDDDNRALQEIIRRYQPKVYNAFVSLEKNVDVSDLTQDALVKITTSLKNLKNPNSFNSWLRQIVNNLFCDYLRKKLKEKSLFDTKDKLIEPENNFLDEEILALDLRSVILREIVNLPATYRGIIVMRDLLGFSYKEIAVFLDISIGTVKSRIARGREKLQEKFSEYIN